MGTWMQQIAMGWLAYKLTGSVLILATVTFMEQIPMLFATPFVSVFVDRANKHKLLIFTQTMAMLQAFAMAALVLTETVAVWNILILSLFIGLVNSLDMPTRQAFYTSLVPKESMTNAIALNSSSINGCRLIGPAVGGIIIGLVGEGYCFLINAISYLGVITALLMMKIDYKKKKSEKKNVLQDMTKGFMYMKNTEPIKILVAMMAAVSFFGVPFNSFVPAFVNIMLNGESEMLGFLLSSIGIGSFAASIYLASRRSAIGLPNMVMSAAVLMGMSLCFISFCSISWAAILICMPIGFSIIISVASINTLLQLLTDNAMRGRVMGYLTMAFAGMPPVGALVFGYIEKWTGLNYMLVIMGMCTILSGVCFSFFLQKVKDPTILVENVG